MTIYIVSGCSNKEYRLPASADANAQNMKCGVKCAFGPVSKSFFRVKSIKVKYASTDTVAPNGVINTKSITMLDTYCKRYSDLISKKTKTPMRYLTLTTKAKVYHGQLLKTSDDGNIALPSRLGYRLQSDNVCF